MAKPAPSHSSPASNAQKINNENLNNNDNNTPKQNRSSIPEVAQIQEKPLNKQQPGHKSKAATQPHGIPPTSQRSMTTKQVSANKTGKLNTGLVGNALSAQFAGSKFATSFNLSKKTAHAVKAPKIKQEDLLEIEMENIEEQINNYLEFCDTISGKAWAPEDIIDILYVMTMSMDLDAVSIILIDPEKPEHFLPVVVRGFKSKPTDDVIELLESAIIPEKPSINWDKLISITGETEVVLAMWLLHEGLKSFSYVPIHDGQRIFGFLMLGNYEKKEHSPIRNQIMELSGGRLGLTLVVNAEEEDDE